MTAGGDSLQITIGGRDVGLADVLRRIDSEMAVSANNAVKLGQSYARLASAQGQPAAAGQILAGTMQRAGAASQQAIIGVETQAARLANSGSYVQQFGQSAASSLASIAGPAALATAAIGGVIAVGQSFADAFTFKATLDANAASLQSALTGFRDVGATTAEAAQFGRQFNITQAQTNSILTSSIDVLKQSSGSVTQLETALLRLGTRDVSKPISEAARAVRELAAGDVTSIKELFNVPAKDALAMKNAIAGGADAIQVLTAWLDKAGVGVDALKQRTQGAAGAMNELAVAQEDLVLAQAAFAQGPGLALLQERIALTSGATRILSGDFAAMGQSLQGVGAEFLANIARQHAWNDALLAGKTQAEAAAAGEAAHAASLNAGAVAAQDAANANAAWNAALIQTGTVVTGVTDIEQQRINVLNATAALSQQATSASLGYADALAMTGIQAAAAAQAAQQKGTADQVASVDAQTHAIAVQKLGDAAKQAAGLLLLNGDAGARTAALLAGSSQQVDVLTAAYYRLAVAQQVAKAADPMKGVTEDRLTRDTQADRAQVGSDKALKANRDLLSSINKVNKAKGGGGGGGAPKLSDQTKLQNSLLASQEDYEQKSEDAATQHAVDVEKINQDFYAKMRQADRDFNQAQLEGRAGFYDQLGSIESPKIAAAASAAYEAASIEAGKIAATHGADVADKYMSAQEQIIGARAKRLSDIEKAEKDKDKGKAEYLRGVDAEYKKAEDAKLARIQEGEGSIASERQKQLDDAAAKEADAQDKIGLSADRAAEKKILASQRSGAMVDQEKIKVDGLKTSYDALGVAGTRAGITPAAGSPAGAPNAAGTPPAAATAPESAPADNPVVAALNAAAAVIVAALSSVERAERDTGGAVRSLKSSGGIAG